jgi:predicted dehydrogenase
MKDQLQWGITGTGGIAGDFTEALIHSTRCKVVNVVGSSAEKGKAFAARWSLPRSSASLEQLLADPAVHAVYIATPHPAHEAQALAAIAAGKHVLCEKPMTVSEEATRRVIDEARRAGVLLMEAFMYRCHPLLAEVAAKLRDGVIGTIRHVRADFGFRVPRNPRGRLFDPALGGGGILDVGGYPVSFARLIAGLVEGKPFAEPVQVSATGHLGPAGADELAAALLTFASGLTASVTCAVFHDVGTQAVIFGDDGKLILPNPWIPQGSRQSLESNYAIERDGAAPQTFTVRTKLPTYGLEAEWFANTLPATEPIWPAMSWEDSLGNMRVLDTWRAALARR